MLHSEKDHEVDQKSVNGLPKIFLFAANGTFWTQKWHVHLDQLLKKKPKSLIFCCCELSSVLASPSIPHNMVPPSKCPPSTTLPSFLRWPPYEPVSQDLRRHTFENSFQQWQPQEEPLKDERGQEVHEKEAMHKNYINNIFTKNNYRLGQMDHFRPKIGTPL